MQDIKKVVEELKHKGAALDTGISIHQVGDNRYITIDVRKAQHKGRKWSDMTILQRQAFEDLLYLST